MPKVIIFRSASGFSLLFAFEYITHRENIRWTTFGDENEYESWRVRNFDRGLLIVIRLILDNGNNTKYRKKKCRKKKALLRLYEIYFIHKNSILTQKSTCNKASINIFVSLTFVFVSASRKVSSIYQFVAS